MNALNEAVEKAKKDQAKQDTEYNSALVSRCFLFFKVSHTFIHSTLQHAEKKRREEMQKQYELELSTREIINHVNGIFLTEQPDIYNIKDGHKYDRFKWILFNFHTLLRFPVQSSS